MTIDSRHPLLRTRTMCAAFLVFAAIAAIPQVAAASPVAICHVPPGNPANAHEITVSVNSIPAHTAHGDTVGPCLCSAEGTVCGPGFPPCCPGVNCVAQGAGFVCQLATSSSPMPPGGACTDSTQCDAVHPCTSVGTGDSICGT